MCDSLGNVIDSGGVQQHVDSPGMVQIQPADEDQMENLRRIGERRNSYLVERSPYDSAQGK